MYFWTVKVVLYFAILIRIQLRSNKTKEFETSFFGNITPEFVVKLHLTTNIKKLLQMAVKKN